MQIVVKPFDALTMQELHRIYAARVSVFVVEQQCPYQEVDDADPVSIHIWLEDETGLLAYARVLPAGTHFSEVSIGRVISLKRRCGYASRILYEAIRVASEQFSATRITLEAQTYARELYEKVGFRPSSEEYLVDGIPHIRMDMEL